MPETNEVMHFIRTNILIKLLKLVAMILEVPEEAVLSTHAPGGSKTEYIRYVRSINGCSVTAMANLQFR